MNINEGQSLIESETYSVEHVKSLFTGGSNQLTNITLVCRKCNYENEKKYVAENAGE
jgi:5-methylcytosine-specific restriction endonuclease McrA